MPPTLLLAASVACLGLVCSPLGAVQGLTGCPLPLLLQATFSVSPYLTPHVTVYSPYPNTLSALLCPNILSGSPPS